MGVSQSRCHSLSRPLHAFPNHPQRVIAVPASRLPKPPSESDCRPGYTPLHAFSNHPKRVMAVPAVRAVRTQQPCDDNIRSRDRNIPRSTQPTSCRAPVLAFEHTPSTDPFLATGRMACDGLSQQQQCCHIYEYVANMWLPMVFARNQSLRFW